MGGDVDLLRCGIRHGKSLFGNLAAYPAALKWIPKPGPWMETFKEILAFPMLLSVVAFVNGFPKDERTAMFTSLIFTWFACWMIGRVPAGGLRRGKKLELGRWDHSRPSRVP
jgi:thiol:disulfide interchange protein